MSAKCLGKGQPFHQNVEEGAIKTIAFLCDLGPLALSNPVSHISSRKLNPGNSRYRACHPRLAATMSSLPLKHPCIFSGPSSYRAGPGRGSKVREILESQSILEDPKNNSELTACCKLKNKDKGIYMINIPIRKAQDSQGTPELLRGTWNPCPLSPVVRPSGQ